MRLFGTLLMATVSCTAPAADVDAPHPQEAAVIAAAERALTAITNEDTLLLRNSMTENATFYAVAGDNGVSFSTVDQMNARFVSGPDFLERMWDPQVSISGRLAMVWTPYDFYLGQEFSHCGIDVFHLADIDGDWKVMSISFTRETENCPPSPLGPPTF